MCASHREPVHEAAEAAQRALEEEEEARLASASLAAGDPTGWFDRLYAAGARGQVPVPWRRRQPHPLLVHWASAQELSGAGQRAVVVGCALGADAARPSPTSAVWSDQVERCWPLPPFTMTTRPTHRSRPGHCGELRLKRSAPAD